MNIENLLEKTLTKPQYKAIKILGDQFHKMGTRAFLVGGTIRDLLLEREVSDIDIIVESDPSNLMHKFDPQYQIDVISNSQFSTCKIKILNQAVDLAMAREEIYPTSGALPVVTSSSIEDDLGRRDFSINALAACINPPNWGEVLDLYRGLEDLQSKHVRILHSGSFKDDPTRIFRCIRYSGRLGFSLEDGTRTQLLEDLTYITLLSGVRITNELVKIYSEKSTNSILDLMDQFEVLGHIHPGFPKGPEFSKRKKLLTDISIPTSELVLYILISLIQTDQRMDLIKRLDLGNKLSKFGRDLNRIELIEVSSSRTKIYKQLTEVSEIAISVADAYVSKELRRNLKLFTNELKTISLCIDGEDLMGIGIPHGPKIGDILSKIFTHMINSGPLSKPDQIRMASKFFGDS
ncbi:MAG: CCA tRNA nucleotidyltransferase [SAR202 cluster bacterium]|nr:CCA tRNA nucleotidyltransferase [SAR202 cluster bacterium]